MSEIERLQQMLAAGAGAQADLSAQLAAHSDPTVRLLAEMWGRREEEKVAEEQAEPLPAVDPLDVDDLGLPGQLDARTLRRHVEHLELELGRLQEINDTLAAALGACEVCWGDDPECETCRGRGGPGSLPPDRALFERLAMPAVRRLRSSQPGPAGREGRPLAHVLPIEDRATTPERREG
ncbi:MAG: hypothetical protein QOH06_2606 [Acidobacteriota bacterium]|nr:hypothetical protein [Acidobacteriota bacterium]